MSRRRKYGVADFARAYAHYGASAILCLYAAAKARHDIGRRESRAACSSHRGDESISRRTQQDALLPSGARYAIDDDGGHGRRRRFRCPSEQTRKYMMLVPHGLHSAPHDDLFDDDDDAPALPSDGAFYVDGGAAPHAPPLDEPPDIDARGPEPADSRARCLSMTAGRGARDESILHIITVAHCLYAYAMYEEPPRTTATLDDGHFSGAL